MTGGMRNNDAIESEKMIALIYLVFDPINRDKQLIYCMVSPAGSGKILARASRDSELRSDVIVNGGVEFCVAKDGDQSLRDDHAT